MYAADDPGRKWAASETYKPPIPFLEMQKKGREMVGGTVIVGRYKIT